MKRALLLSFALCMFPQPAAAKDVVMAPADYQMYSAYAARGLDKQCMVLTSGKELLDSLTKLRVNKPEAVPAMISPPIDWSTSAIVLMYQPDPPPETFPSVRSLIKDVNKEKFTLLYRYLTKKEFEAEAAAAAAANSPPSTSPAAQNNPAQPAGTVAAVTAPRPRTFGYSIEAYTVGTDDQRDRSKLPSPLLMVVIPKLPFVNNRTPVDCTPKT